MAKTVFEDAEKLESVAVAYVPRVKQMVRKFGAQPAGDMDAIQTVDSELSAYVNDGWKLAFTHRLATEPEGFTILYILTKD